MADPLAWRVPEGLKRAASLNSAIDLFYVQEVLFAENEGTVRAEVPEGVRLNRGLMALCMLLQNRAYMLYSKGFLP